MDENCAGRAREIWRFLAIQCVRRRAPFLYNQTAEPVGRHRERHATTHQPTITQLLQGAAAGSDSAAAQLLPVVYNQLHALASAFFRDQRPGNTLQPTALVHEAYIKLVDQTGIDWTGRKQFFALASKAMRSILVDHARSKGALKRGGNHQRIALDEADRTPTQLDDLTVLAIDEAMVKLSALDKRKARLV